MTDKFPCPKDDCDYVGDKRKNLKIHYGRAHEGSLADRYDKICAECGAEFTVRPNSKDQQYCSTECWGSARSEKLTIHCEECGDSFDVHPCKADRRRFCSRDCRRQAFSVTLNCGHCGDSFRVYRTESHREYCSQECLNNHLREQSIDVESRACNGCGYVFTPRSSSRDQQFCSESCYNEFQRHSENRPDTLDALLEELYVEQDHNLRETHKRLNTALHHDDYGEDYLSKPDVRERLQDLGLWNTHLDVYKAAVAAGEEADQDDDEVDDSWQEYYQPEEVAGDD